MHWKNTTKNHLGLKRAAAAAAAALQDVVFEVKLAEVPAEVTAGLAERLGQLEQLEQLEQAVFQSGFQHWKESVARREIEY